jgi:hypothetical protein
MVFVRGAKTLGPPSLAGSVAERLLQCKASPAEKAGDFERRK